MSKDRDPLLDIGVGQFEFNFGEEVEKQRKVIVEIVGETLDGHNLYRRKEAHGGWSYWCDDVPPARRVFDEGLDNPLTLFEALEHLGVGKQMWESIGASLGYK